MRIELSQEAADQLQRIADEDRVPPTDLIEALIAAEVARRQVREVRDELRSALSPT